MRVLIDAHMVGSRETGNETYVVNLLAGLSQLSNGRYAAALRAHLSPPARWSGIDVLSLRPAGDAMRLLYTLPRLARKWRADLLHVTYVGPFWLPCPLVVTVHDVSFKRFAQFFSPRDRLLFTTLLPLTLRRAWAVITLSEHSRREILSLFPYLEGRVHVTHAAAAPEFRPNDDRTRMEKGLARYGVSRPFVLAVGNLQPRKNLARLVKAFARVHQTLPQVQLVIAGQAAWKSSEVYAIVKELGLAHEVVFTGYLPLEDLVLMYGTAAAFVYPSLYEGFGLPVLEAMACGAPVIASNTTSLPEVVGDAGLLIDPYEEEQMAEAVLHVLTKPDLAQSLAVRGLARASRFTWRRTAEETVQVYVQCLSGRCHKGP